MKISQKIREKAAKTVQIKIKSVERTHKVSAVQKPQSAKVAILWIKIDQLNHLAAINDKLPPQEQVIWRLFAPQLAKIGRFVDFLCPSRCRGVQVYWFFVCVECFVYTALKGGGGGQDGKAAAT